MRGDRKGPIIPWTEEELTFVKTKYEIECWGSKQIAEHLPGRTRRAVQHIITTRRFVQPEPQPGDKFNRFTIVSKRMVHRHGQQKTLALVRCECGVEKEVVLTAIKSGKTQSCGCYKSDVQRKLAYARNERNRLLPRPTPKTSTRLYGIYKGMKERCLARCPERQHYFDKGVRVCDEWLESFEVFKAWSEANGYDDTRTIDRIDGNGIYSPENCRWTDCFGQANNRIDNRRFHAFGTTKTIAEWSRDPVVSLNMLLYDAVYYTMVGLQKKL